MGKQVGEQPDMRTRVELKRANAALRARIEELEGALRLIVSYHQDGTMPLNSAEANMAACARRALESDHGEQENGNNS